MKKVERGRIIVIMKKFLCIIPLITFCLFFSCCSNNSNSDKNAIIDYNPEYLNSANPNDEKSYNENDKDNDKTEQSIYVSHNVSMIKTYYTTAQIVDENIEIIKLDIKFLQNHNTTSYSPTFEMVNNATSVTNIFASQCQPYNRYIELENETATILVEIELHNITDDSTLHENVEMITELIDNTLTFTKSLNNFGSVEIILTLEDN